MGSRMSIYFVDTINNVTNLESSQDWGSDDIVDDNYDDGSNN